MVKKRHPANHGKYYKFVTQQVVDVICKCSHETLQPIGGGKNTNSGVLRSMVHKSVYVLLTDRWHRQKKVSFHFLTNKASPQNTST
jgi:hypothetical protein